MGALMIFVPLIIWYVGLDCEAPYTTPSDVDDFVAICAEDGAQAQCCVLPLLGQGLLCQDV